MSRPYSERNVIRAMYHRWDNGADCMYEMWDMHTKRQ